MWLTALKIMSENRENKEDHTIDEKIQGFMFEKVFGSYNLWGLKGEELEDAESKFGEYAYGDGPEKSVLIEDATKIGTSMLEMLEKRDVRSNGLYVGRDLEFGNLLVQSDDPGLKELGGNILSAIEDLEKKHPGLIHRNLK